MFNEALKATSAVVKTTVAHTTALVRKAGQELAVLGQAAKAEIAAIAESEIALAKTAEGLEIAIDAKTAELTKVSQTQKFEMNALDKVKGASKAEASAAKVDATIESVKWTAHGHKHVSCKNISWKEITRSTKNGAAKYLPETNIESLERFAWKNGIPTTNGKPWKVLDNKKIIGASNGIETQYMRVESSANTIHGHPISLEDYRKLIK